VKNMFRIQNVSKSFVSANKQSISVLNQISFDVQMHDFISTLGPSGSGKTTLLRILAGFDKEFQGNLSISGSDIQSQKASELLGKIGYIPQDNSLFPWLNVEDNIRFGMNIRDIPKLEQDRIVNQLLSLVGLEKFRKYYPKEISGGMKQKVAICRALAIQPISNLILMDEPFSALDSQTRNSLQTDLLNIWNEKKLTIIFVTHNIDEAVFLSNKILVFSPAPAHILYSHTINFPHPRDRTSVEFNQIRREIFQYFNNNKVSSTLLE
jgi:NitT/TauT family transport system ATP-binding protein